MKNAKEVLKKLLYPPLWVVLLVSLLSFGTLAFVFASESTESMTAYAVYSLSAYALTVLILAVPQQVRRAKAALANAATVQRLRQSKYVALYLADPAFRGSVGIGVGVIVDFFYAGFRIVTGIRFASVWFVSMAVYYAVLGALRLYLLCCRRRRDAQLENRCYRRTAWLLFLLNVTMGGMIFQMVKTNAGYAYPGYIIYLSAIYTFYSMTVSVINLVKFRKVGSPALSAAKVLGCIAAMMSVLGLQTAMIAQFGGGEEHFRRIMNTVTGGVIYGIVLAVAIYMLLHSRNLQKRGQTVEQV